jgi:hypothetical protein
MRTLESMSTRSGPRKAVLAGVICVAVYSFVCGCALLPRQVATPTPQASPTGFPSTPLVAIRVTLWDTSPTPPPLPTRTRLPLATLLPTLTWTPTPVPTSTPLPLPTQTATPPVSPIATPKRLPITGK